MLRVDKSCVLKVILGKCRPMPSPVHRVCSVDYSSTTEQLFNQQHHGESSEFRAWTNDNGADYDLEKQLTIRQVASLFPRLNNISFECTELETDVTNTVDDDLMSICPEPIPSTANAFGELMQNSKKRFFHVPKSSISSSFNRKDELYNEVVSIFKNENIDFPTFDEAHYCVSVLTNALGYGYFLTESQRFTLFHDLGYVAQKPDIKLNGVFLRLLSHSFSTVTPFSCFGSVALKTSSHYICALL